MHSLSRGTSPTVTVRIPKELMDEMDRWRASQGVSRSAFLRGALRIRLKELNQKDGAQ